jgi:aminoglycoside phosphotransferase (APT) family kinase protein
LPITDVEKQGHDNRTYRLGEHMLIRMPTAADYALKVPKEQELLPQLAKRLSVSIPAPIKMGKPTYIEETPAVARKMSGELAEAILIGEHKRNPKSFSFYEKYGWHQVSIHEDVDEPYILYGKS